MRGVLHLLRSWLHTGLVCCQQYDWDQRSILHQSGKMWLKIKIVRQSQAAYLCERPSLGNKITLSQDLPQGFILQFSIQKTCFIVGLHNIHCNSLSWAFYQPPSPCPHRVKPLNPLSAPCKSLVPCHTVKSQLKTTDIPKLLFDHASLSILKFSH